MRTPTASSRTSTLFSLVTSRAASIVPTEMARVTIRNSSVTTSPASLPRTNTGSPNRPTMAGRGSGPAR
jgi:hypothetical protein